MIVRIDGPMGERLEAAGHDVSPPSWSARVLRTAPHAVAALHREYAHAGCSLHRANTFRCSARASGADWQQLARLAVTVARNEAALGQRVAGSLGPLEDCYRPDLSPRHSGPEHQRLAELLAPMVDVLFCETFPNPREAREAVAACAATGRPTWVSLTAGPDGTLLSPQQVKTAARDCVAAGASAVLVNCIAAPLTLKYVEALAECGVPFGAYANTARWNQPPCTPAEYGTYAQTWRAAGATLLGGCCGCTVAHLEAAWNGELAT